MNASPLPPPLVPAEVNLSDFPFMPLDVLRLRDSDLASEETPESCWAAVLLWCASWHQTPAGSIPDSENWQAKHAGYVSRGRIDPAWADVRSGALRNWVLCSDGRLYHPVVAEKARQAWTEKVAQRARTRKATEAREAKRREQLGASDVGDKVGDNSTSRSTLRERDVQTSERNDAEPERNEPPETYVTSLSRERDVHQGTGTGTGTGTGIEKKESAPATFAGVARAGSDSPDSENPRPAPIPSPTPAGAVCLAMRRAGMQAVNPGDPRLLALIEQGATIAEFEGFAVEAVGKGKGFAWVLAALVSRRAEAAKLSLAPAAPLTVVSQAAERTVEAIEQQRAHAEAARAETPEQKRATSERLRLARERISQQRAAL